MAYAKANPGKLSCGHGNSTGHITCETVKARLGLDMTRVPYKIEPARVAGSVVQQHPPDGAGFLRRVPLKAGTVIALAAVMRQRSQIVPDVPTFHETVIKDFEVAPWVSMLARQSRRRPSSARCRTRSAKS